MADPNQGWHYAKEAAIALSLLGAPCQLIRDSPAVEGTISKLPSRPVTGMPPPTATHKKMGSLVDVDAHGHFPEGVASID